MLFLLFCAPLSARADEKGSLVLAVGLSTYNPPLAQVRERLRAAGGGKLVAIDDYQGETLYLALGLAGRDMGLRSQPRIREIAYFRYRGQSEQKDYLIEIERYTGSILSFFKENRRARLQPYWGSGIGLIRMKREGAVEQRGAPQTTQQDWLWGLCGFTGVEYFLSGRIAIGARYTYDLVPTSIFSGVEYGLSGKTFSYDLSLHWRPRAFD